MLIKGFKSLVRNSLIMATRKRNSFGLWMENVIDGSYYDRTTTYPYRGYEAMQCLLKNYEFDTVLDVGCGEGVHSDVFLKAGKKVTAIDYGKSYYFGKMKSEPGFTCIVDDFMKHDFGGQTFGCVWCSHVLEHQLNVQDFLTKLVRLVKTTDQGGGGILAITVPPYHPEIVGGHVSLWNAGLLLYRLVLAGVNCRDARVKTYGYNISVIVRMSNIIDVKSRLSYDMGDLRAIREYLPSELKFIPSEHDDPYYGNIERLNWD